MSHDAWVSTFMLVATGDMTMEDHVNLFRNPRRKEIVGIAEIRSEDRSTGYAVIRRGAKGGEYLRAYFVPQPPADGRESWDVVVETRGRYPMTLGRTILDALRLNECEDEVVISNSAGTLLNSTIAGINPNPASAISLFRENGCGFMFVVRGTDSQPFSQADHRLLQSFFHVPGTPVLVVRDEVRERIERDLGMEIAPNSVNLFVSSLRDGISLVGTYRRGDRTSGRRIARDADTAATRVAAEMEREFSLGNVLDMGADHDNKAVPNTPSVAPKTDAPTVDTVVMERRLARAESNLSAADAEIRRLTTILREHGIDPQEGAVAVTDTGIAEEDAPGASPLHSPARELSERERGRRFSSFAEVESYAREHLTYVRITPDAFAAKESISVDKRASGWIAATWSALLALNEYGEFLNTGGGERNIHLFLKRHPHPTISHRRVAMRESDTTRGSRLMDERVFSVDGTDVVMESHFKIDASGRHPAPRMHFAEVDGMQTVGYLGPHLRTKATN